VEAAILAGPGIAVAALTVVIRESSGTGFEDEMNYDTRFFAKRASRPR
jgi:hypothetical protein